MFNEYVILRSVGLILHNKYRIFVWLVSLTMSLHYVEMSSIHFCMFFTSLAAQRLAKGTSIVEKQTSLIDKTDKNAT